MQPSITDRILYGQLLTRAGYTVHAITAVHACRGGVALDGAFTLDDVTQSRVDVTVRRESVVIGKQEFFLNVQPDGTFGMFIAHCDDPTG